MFFVFLCCWLLPLHKEPRYKRFWHWGNVLVGDGLILTSSSPSTCRAGANGRVEELGPFFLFCFGLKELTCLFPATFTGQDITSVYKWYGHFQKQYVIFFKTGPAVLLLGGYLRGIKSSTTWELYINTVSKAVKKLDHSQIFIKRRIETLSNKQ